LPYNGGKREVRAAGVGVDASDWSWSRVGKGGLGGGAGLAIEETRSRSGTQMGFSPCAVLKASHETSPLSLRYFGCSLEGFKGKRLQVETITFPSHGLDSAV